MCKLFAEIKNAISQDEAKAEQVNVFRSKHQLLTSVSTPDQSPCDRKLSRAQAKVPSSPKSLFLSEGALNITVDQCRKEDMPLEHVNINNLQTVKHESTVKVFIAHPNGNVVICTPSDKQSIHLVKNVSLKNWKAVANGVFVHPFIWQELPSVLQRAVPAEFKDYSCSDSVLKGIE